MELEAVIIKTVEPNDDFITVEFAKDHLKQKFEVFFADYKPFARKMRIYDRIILKIKFKPEDYLDENRIRTRTKLYGKLIREISFIP